ncbi:dihydroorotate dehydrogenase-like protein, partial [bacterium]|nr:dihydroorotate dehydrogenase-like protein [bacterium]
MADLSTKLMGLDLKNPVIVASSGLTNSLERLKECEEAGAAAVVLKSIFEEEIVAEVDGIVAAAETPYAHAEAADYIRNYGQENAVRKFIELISDAKKELSIPVIASIHCASAGGWTDFAGRVEAAGADALELNIFVLPSDPERDGRDHEQIYFDVLAAVKKQVTIPVALKVGGRFSGLAHTAHALADGGADALVLFNRFARFDFDIEKMEMVPASYLSSPEEAFAPLRWIAILAGEISCDLVATTGVHDGRGVVKQLLAGASAVEICSVLYRHGVSSIGPILDEISSWMDAHG